MRILIATTICNEPIKNFDFALKKYDVSYFGDSPWAKLPNSEFWADIELESLEDLVELSYEIGRNITVHSSGTPLTLMIEPACIKDEDWEEYEDWDGRCEITDNSETSKLDDIPAEYVDKNTVIDAPDSAESIDDTALPKEMSEDNSIKVPDSYDGMIEIDNPPVYTVMDIEDITCTKFVSFKNALEHYEYLKSTHPSETFVLIQTEHKVLMDSSMI